MMHSTFLRFLAAAMILGSLSGCANTIRGVGKDAANTVDATQNAGRRISEAVY